ncbi:MAG: sulfite exporter TauE/SafE family protein [Verrucomicrobia bacterium]|nr:sulfite exporter TauE/SafE family protein [Verrucomicrobiota bacterium]
MNDRRRCRRKPLPGPCSPRCGAGVPPAAKRIRLPRRLAEYSPPHIAHTGQHYGIVDRLPPRLCRQRALRRHVRPARPRPAPTRSHRLASRRRPPGLQSGPRHHLRGPGAHVRLGGAQLRARRRAALGFLSLGVALLTGVLAARVDIFRLPLRGIGLRVKHAMGPWLRRPGLGALAVLGALNGLLPCGLVYVACFAAAATGQVLTAIEYMLVFGLGTVPMMLGLSLAGGALPVPLRLRLQRAIPYCLALVGVLLILRGLALGIPYVSPNLANLAATPAAATCCH